MSKKPGDSNPPAWTLAHHSVPPHHRPIFSVSEEGTAVENCSSVPAGKDARALQRPCRTQFPWQMQEPLAARAEARCPPSSSVARLTGRIEILPVCDPAETGQIFPFSEEFQRGLLLPSLCLNSSVLGLPAFWILHEVSRQADWSGQGYPCYPHPAWAALSCLIVPQPWQPTLLSAPGFQWENLRASKELPPSEGGRKPERLYFG